MQRIVIALFFLLISVLGLDRYSTKIRSSFQKETPLDEDFWRYTSSGLTPLSQKEEASSVAQIYAGSLRINPFGVLTSPKNNFFDVQLLLASKSDPIHIQIQNDNQKSSLDISPTTYQIQNNGDWLPYKGNFRLYVKNQQTWIQTGAKNTRIASYPIETIELSSKVGTAHITKMQLLDDNYGIIYKRDFSEQKQEGLLRFLGLGIGALSGLLIFFVTLRSSAINTIFTSIFIYPSIIWVFSTTPDQWSILIQKLYLTQTKTWELARYSLYAGLIPTLLGFGAVLSFRPQGRIDSLLSGQRSLFLYVIFSSIILYISNIGQPPGLFLVWEFLFLMLPLWLFRSTGINRYIIYNEIPTALLIIVGGWGIGFFTAVLWRLTVLLSSISFFRKNKINRALDCIAITCLFIPISIETTVRSTYLNKAWDVKTLSAKYNQDDPSEYLISMYNESCGSKAQKRNVVFIGGSSTGGVFQFRKTPHLFFAGQTHTKLCAQLGMRFSLNTKNYGRAAMDTHIIAQSFDNLLHTTKADLVVMYVGNNDLLTRKSPLSKKQLQQRMDHWQSQISGIKKYTSASRTIIGSSLIFRQLDKSTKMVVSVPTYDAKENFETIAQIAANHNTHVLLLTEFINPSVIQPVGKNSDEIDINIVFEEYAYIQESIAQKYPHIHFLDTWTRLTPFVHEDLFIDSNHLNMQGNKRVSDVITPKMIEILTATQ